MPQGTCAVSDCGNTGKLRRGMCNACYLWCQANPGKDPANRKRHRRAPADGQCTIVENSVKCTGAHRANGMCWTHLKRVQKHGDPLHVTPRSRAVEDLLHQAARATTDACIYLTRASGRPRVLQDGKAVQASRAVWIIANGDPGEAHVLHTCNGGSGASGCINIRHLRLGTHEENVRDMVEADRHARGERQGNHKLTEEQVREIRQRYATGRVSQRALATEFGVDTMTVNHVVRRLTWKHVL
ncbi:helix-turn-helix domain-containing protein [Streptomyces sp. NPDC006355]|uniref:helix-turn-helix domain-containing protein n=1 Tax=Streptomyces sp. NPDC006355 TaxID=3156758 RepID=UPI0033BC54BC